MCSHKNRGKGKRKESRRPQTPLLSGGNRKEHTGQWPQGKSSSINQEMNPSWIQMHRSSFTMLIVVEWSLQDREVQLERWSLSIWLGQKWEDKYVQIRCQQMIEPALEKGR